MYCWLRGVSFGKGLRTFGRPLIRKHPQARIICEDHVVLNSDSRVNLAGIDHSVILAAPYSNSQIHIGNNSGMSGGVIYAADSVTIGNHVNIGANTCIYDTDFHSLDFQKRRQGQGVDEQAKPVVIEDDVWIGGHSIILKGVTIGRGAVVGAGSVVTKNIPPFTVWAGNPARLIRELNQKI
ncbi:MAG: acyltransferase [Candidatus Omnitrophica bacterium]|nr:acyltransferase [Candidatus Omnitrophota bacterium]